MKINRTNGWTSFFMKLTFCLFKYPVCNLICFLFDNMLIVYQWLNYYNIHFCISWQTIELYIYKCIYKLYCCILLSLFVCLMVFNATFNNISVISWRSVLLVEKTGVLGENPRLVASHWQTLSHAPRHERGSNSQL